jgi:hypothetical protein
MEDTHVLPGGPALHLHLNLEEWYYVMEREVAFQAGEQRLQLHAGNLYGLPAVCDTFTSMARRPVEC